MAGSPTASVCVSGDAVGPVFEGGEPASLAETAFPTGHGRFDGGRSGGE